MIGGRDGMPMRSLVIARAAVTTAFRERLRNIKRHERFTNSFIDPGIPVYTSVISSEELWHVRICRKGALKARDSMCSINASRPSLSS